MKKIGDMIENYVGADKATTEDKQKAIEVLSELKNELKGQKPLDKVVIIERYIDCFNFLNLGVVSAHLKHAIRDYDLHGGIKRQIDTAGNYLEISISIDNEKLS